MTFFFRSCTELEHSNIVEHQTPVEENIVITVDSPSIEENATTSKIKIKNTTRRNSTSTVKSSLNHHTELTVGMIDNNYAVVIHSNKPEPISTSDNKIASIVDQEFGDEIEKNDTQLDENPTLIISNDELVVETGPKDYESESSHIVRLEDGSFEDDLLVARGNDVVIDLNGENNDMDLKEEDEFGDESFDINSIDEAYLLGKFNPATHKDFVLIPSAYGNKKGMYARKEVFEAYKKMYLDALKAGIELKILSATRSFSSQKRIWEAKWSGKRRVDGKDLSKAIPFGVDRAKKILEYSSMPGTSRHHWGTDLDFVALENEYFEKGHGKKVYDWLTKHASKYGFYQPYTAREFRKTGHNEEKWHWSYLPISKPLIKKYKQSLDNEEIIGFKGQKTAKEIDIIQNFVLGVDKECQ